MDTKMEARQIRPFAEFLREHRRGELSDEVAGRLNELVEAVSVYRKPGTITLTLTVKPMGKGRDNAVMVTDEVNLKLPRAERDPSLFFMDASYNLVRKDPNQTEMPFVRKVETDTEVARDTAEARIKEEGQ